MEFKKVYEPKEVEKKWYQVWEENGYFLARVDSPKPKYCITIPPPNITGALHIGHALNNTIQDILIRYKRMAGFETLWLPGTDHASIATHNQIEKELAKEGKTRFDLGREEFLKRAWAWKEKYANLIIAQLKALGCSCDWSRTRFTMDEDLSFAVRYAFVHYYKKGLIYRDNLIINFCPRCRTALSDLEVRHIEKDGFLWFIKYPLKSGGYISVATTRPETMLGDTAVAVNPKDERYKDLVGKVAILPLAEREIPIIAEELVDPNFGTGAVKVTPAHDPNDFIIGKKHSLSEIKVIDEDGKMTSLAPKKYQGLTREACREAVIEDLRNIGLLEKVKPYQISVGTCARCETIVEPLTSKQWFLKMKDLAQPAIEVVKNGEIKFVPKRWEKVYLDWLSSVKDWCLSRQLWWGHRIPVFYCAECNETIVELYDPKTCPQCNSQNISQDEDILDTWFSSALWPFSTLGWPKETKELSLFYPTDVLSTDPDIIFLWVARMVFSSLEFLGKIPFKYVYIHSTVLTEKGERMSRTKGTGVDPISLIEKYGTDALRFTLTYLETQSQSFRLSEKKFELGRNFANKIWNAGRLLYEAVKLEKNSSDIDEYLTQNSKINLSAIDWWIISCYQNMATKIKNALEGFYFSVIAQTLYEFFWGEFCDWYLEFVKERLNRKEESCIFTLRYIFSGFLRFLHPIMPFITEELWQRFNFSKKNIMVSPFPFLLSIPEDKKKDCEKVFELKTLIKEVRSIRQMFNVEKNVKSSCLIKTDDEDFFNFLKEHKPLLEKLARIESLDRTERKEKGTATIFLKSAECYIPLYEMFEWEKERAKFMKEVKELEKELERIEQKLSNEEFLNKAKSEVIEREKEKKLYFENKLRRLKELV